MNKRIFSCFSSAISSSLTVLVLFLPVLLSCSRKQEDMKPFDLVSRLEMQKTVTEVKTHSRIKKVVRWNIQKGTQTAMDSVLTYPFNKMLIL